ncbi:hypothetical protein RBG61_06305 [Paludicola sp. MB14-C6]|uniref:hypothetical protein n=1 Tax=Paludihabitans sp. MB14-C6 TaxID=3070656 RepID=UPI0027DC8445|nr:hypothetical protein [Paludicola sp. MB14-C6]WMJ24273.1 hypothetical protein RBG61_06305 [Paludicola sp. MB14-C6]
MKVCIIGQTDKKYLPYVTRYTDFLSQHDIAYDIIYWQQEDLTIHSEPNEYYFKEPLREGFYKKLQSYHRFRNFIIPILQNGNYDRIIVLTTIPCILLRKYLLKNYQNRYLFDIRDYTFEKYGFYRKWVNQLIDHSALTTISSRGFLDFLTSNDKIVVNHNVSFFDQEKTTALDLKQKQVINISFLGKVRYFDENCSLLTKLKNTFRYQLWYIGKPEIECDLPTFCKDNEITNVSFVENYANEQKPILYENIDIINSIYDEYALTATTALPHRLYEACIFKKPILSSKQTYLGEIIAKYGLGVVVNVLNDDVLSILDKYVDTFDPDQFIENCNRFLADVRNDEVTLYERLEAFIK